MLQTVLSLPAFIGGAATKVIVTISETFEQPLNAEPVTFNVTAGAPKTKSAGSTL